MLGFDVKLVVLLRDTNAALKSLQQAQQPEFQEEAQDMPGSWVVKGLVLAMLTYIGMNVAPMMGMINLA